MSEKNVLKALQALAEEDRSREARPHIEERLLAEVRSLRAAGRSALQVRQLTSQPDRKRVSLWIGAAAAAACFVVLALWPRSTPPVQSSEPAKPSEPRPSGSGQVVLAQRPVKLPRSRLKQPPAPERPREILTEFFPVPNAAPPFERGALLRVVVPASTMTTVGLPVREDRWEEPVEADMLVGQEGIVRAIRFVSYER
jgi:hypothetical protein